MTQEDKSLLLKDLSARLPYGVRVKSRRGKSVTLSLYVMTDFHLGCSIKPYLRPISSMTEGERKEYWDITSVSNHCAAIDWLNAHHFDYRGLIEKGLAIAVTEENNPYKD